MTKQINYGKEETNIFRDLEEHVCPGCKMVTTKLHRHGGGDTFICQTKGCSFYINIEALAGKWELAEIYEQEINRQRAEGKD